VAILLLVTVAVMVAAIGLYQDKETVESALLRSIMNSSESRDVVGFDRYY